MQGIDAERSRAIAAETELIKRIQGTSSDSNSRLDPFKLLGYPESYESLGKGYGSYEEFNDALDGLLYDANVSPGQNYGYFRARVLWRDVEIKNILLSSSQRNMIQVISGTLKVNSDGLVIADDWAYRVLWRQHTDSDGWSTWKEYAGASSSGGGTVDDEIVAQVNKNTTNIAQNTSNIEKLMKEIFPLTVSFSISPSALQEYGTTVNTVTANWSIDGADVEVLGVELQLGSEGEVIDVTGKTSYIFNNAGITKNTTVFFVAEISGEDVVNKSSSINFAYAAYMDVVDKDFVINESNITALTKQSLSTSKSRNYTTLSALSLQKIVYAYAQTYGAISKVLDGNSFDVTDSFEQKTTTINGIPYYVYVSKEATTTNTKVTVKFS